MGKAVDILRFSIYAREFLRIPVLTQWGGFL